MPAHKKTPQWFNIKEIEKALSANHIPETGQVHDILAKSLELQPLNVDEIAALARVENETDRLLIIGTADLVKQKTYGDRIVLTAPLHISNYCSNECLYCAYRKNSPEIRRKRLEPQEVKEAGRKLIRQGHKRLILVSGQSTTADVEYYAEAINALCHIFEGNGEIRRINLDLGDLAPEDYAILQQTDVGSIHIYQETYQQSAYEAAHAVGPKRDFVNRLEGPHRALQADMKDVGLGLALGLGSWIYDLLGISLHAAALAKEFGVGPRTLNLHRVRPAPGCSWQPPHPLVDEEFLRCVAIARLAIPYTGILLTTREPAGLWKEACNAGCSQLLTGSVANPYESWIDAPGEKAPFPIGEETHLDEVVRFLLEKAHHLPSFCTACPRLGRSGSEFINMAQAGDIKILCGPNSLGSFMEFLLNYATPYTRQLGEKLIQEKLEQMPEHDRLAAEKLLRKVRSGRLDEFI